MIENWNLTISILLILILMLPLCYALRTISSSTSPPTPTTQIASLNSTHALCLAFLLTSHINSIQNWRDLQMKNSELPFLFPLPSNLRMKETYFIKHIFMYFILNTIYQLSRIPAHGAVYLLEVRFAYKLLSWQTLTFLQESWEVKGAIWRWQRLVQVI